MINLYLPTDFIPGTGLMDNIHIPEKPADVKRLAFEGKAILFPNALRNYVHAPQHHQGGLLVTLGSLRIVKGTSDKTVILKWFFANSAKNTPWGGEVKLQFSPSAGTPSVIVRQRINRNALNIAPEDLERDIAAVMYAVSVLISKKAEEVSDRHPSNTSILQAMNISSHLHTAVQNGINVHVNSQTEKKDRGNKIRDLMSSLPDGTPLIVRSNHGNTWQIGLKKGRMDVTLARNSMIAPRDILRGEELRAAGLSAHDVLPLEAVAFKAREQYPQACNFQSDDPKMHRRAKLHSHQPFHKSFMVGSRRKTPVAWLETDSGRATLQGGFEIKGDNPLRFPDAPPGHRPYMVPHNNRIPQKVTVQETRRVDAQAPDIHKFSRVASLWVVTEEVKTLMQEYQIGDVSFSPVDLLDINGTPFEGSYFYISLDTPVSAAMPELTDRSVYEYRFGRVIQPFEFTIDPKRTKGLDFWWDPEVRQGSLFFSDRLYKALKRIKAMPRIAAKPCAAYN
jgi:hypothetical protein